MVRPRSRPRTSLLRVESLEDRSVPAGNVTTQVYPFNGYQTLRVIGDAEGNDVFFRGTGKAGGIELTGFKTTIDGSKQAATFSGIDRVLFIGGAGNDAMLTRSLQLSVIEVYNGSGDDTVAVWNTKDTGDGLSINISGDDPYAGSELTNGSDFLLVSGVTTTGGNTYLSVQGDFPHDDNSGGRDVMAITNVNVRGTSFWVDVLPDYGANDPGNVIMLQNIKADIAGETIFNTPFIEGGPGDDTFVLRNIDLKYRADVDAIVEWNVGSYEGNDTIDVQNVRVDSKTAGVGDAPYGYFNQTFMSFFATTVHVNNFRLTGGGYFYDDYFGGYYNTGAWLSVTGSRVDVRNVELHTYGFGGIGVGNTEWFDGNERDDCWDFTNVRVSSDSGDQAEIWLGAGGGDDRIDLRNVSCELFTADLGEGDDRLSLVNVTGNIIQNEYGTFGGIYGGGGDDEVELKNCTFPNLIVDLGDGDDTLTLKHNTIGIASLIGGEGNDRLRSHHNDIDFLTVDGFEDL